MMVLFFLAFTGFSSYTYIYSHCHYRLPFFLFIAAFVKGEFEHDDSRLSNIVFA